MTGPRCKFIHDDIQDSVSAPGKLEGIALSPNSVFLPADQLTTKLSQLYVTDDSVSSNGSLSVSPRTPRTPDNMSPFIQSPRSPELDRTFKFPTSNRGHAVIDNTMFLDNPEVPVFPLRKESSSTKSRLPVFQDIGNSKGTSKPALFSSNE